MRSLFFVFLCLFFFSCASYETEQLYGDWQGETMGITLNEDGTAELRLDGGSRKVEWRDAIGNTLEISSGGKVIMSNLTVKNVTADTLTIETRDMVGNRSVGEVIHKMARVK